MSMPLPPTAFDDIMAAVQAALRAAPPLCAAEQVLQDIEAAEMPEDVDRRIVISFAGSQGGYSFASGYSREWRTTLRIDCVVRVDNPTNSLSAGSRARPAMALLGAAMERLDAEFEATQFNGTVMSIESTTIDQDHEIQDTRLGGAWAVLQLRHRTQANLITSPL